MPEVIGDMTITLDGYAAGEGQSHDRPMGDIDVGRIHAWLFDHRGENEGEHPANAAFGAFIIGRNMFGPDRGDWDLDWHGWWGPNPPFQVPTFVLGHRSRPSLEMEGGTVFHFVNDGIDAALERARKAAGGRDVVIAGGPGTLDQYLAAGLVDELRLHLVPFVAGGGERLFARVGDLELKPVSSRTTPHVTHLVYRR
jgi:dihydrofolate reductase